MAMGSEGDSRPLVSVVVPVYDAERHLDRCVASICAQDYENLEVLLVDDGSTDASGALCDEWAARDARVIAMHEANAGAAAARNAALDRARGEWVCLVDSDDVAEPALVGRLLEAAAGAGADIAICGYRRIDEAGEELSRRELRGGMAGDMHDLMRAILVDELFPSPWAKLWSARVLADVRYPVGVYYEDARVWADLVARHADATFVTVGECLYDYRIVDSGYMGSYHDDREAERIDAWYAVCDAFERRYGAGDSPAEVSFRRMHSWFEVVDRALANGRTPDAPLVTRAIAELRSHRAEILASPYYTGNRKRALRLLLAFPRLYAAVVRREGQSRKRS